MDSSQCTLVILSPTTYTTSHHYPYIDMLRSVFEQVLLEEDTTLQQKYHHNTLFLMDLDIIHDHDDGASISSSNSSCTSTMDHRLTWIKKLSQQYIHHPVIVTSSETNGTFMLDCLHAGAADYLVKPLYLPVIQTLFLKLHRRQVPESTPSATTNTSTTTLEIATPNNVLHEDDVLLPTTIQEDMNHRFKEIVTKDIQLTKAMMDIYAPPLPFPAKYIPLSSRQADEIKQKLEQWDFSPFDFNHDELIHCVYLIFEMALSLPELSHFTVSQDQLYDFIIDLANAYHDDNPYHNFAHAVDVLQCIYYFLNQLGILSTSSTTTTFTKTNKHIYQKILKPKQAFALLLSAIGHDAGHPGVNNMFLINSRTPLAVMYNDRSVLESLHSMTLFQLIKKHGLDQWWSENDYQCFRQTIISSILATDMALNNDYVEKFNRQIKLMNENHDHELSDPILLCTALIKCADVSNVTRPFRRGKDWAKLLVEEFASQGDLERELGMPVQATNDRNKIVTEDCQIGFIKFVAMDLFTTVSDLLPELQFTTHHLRQNLQLWELEKISQQSLSSLHHHTSTETSTAGTKRRLSYCLEASTPPSLNSNNNNNSTINSNNSNNNNSNNNPHFNHHHYLNQSKKQMMEKLPMDSSSSTASNSLSSHCIIQ
ncbi:unnamed protein product [Cunninghamella blakesleeana]